MLEFSPLHLDLWCISTQFLCMVSRIVFKLCALPSGAGEGVILLRYLLNACVHQGLSLFTGKKNISPNLKSFGSELPSSCSLLCLLSSALCTHRLMFRKRLEETPKSKYLESLFYVALFSPYCPWKFHLLSLPRVCLLNSARLLSSAGCLLSVLRSGNCLQQEGGVKTIELFSIF